MNCRGTAGDVWRGLGPETGAQAPRERCKANWLNQPGGGPGASAPAGVQGREEATLARTSSSPRVAGGAQEEAELKVSRSLGLLVSYRPLA